MLSPLFTLAFSLGAIFWLQMQGGKPTQSPVVLLKNEGNRLEFGEAPESYTLALHLHYL